MHIHVLGSRIVERKVELACFQNHFGYSGLLGLSGTSMKFGSGAAASRKQEQGREDEVSQKANKFCQCQRYEFLQEPNFGPGQNPAIFVQ